MPCGRSSTSSAKTGRRGWRNYSDRSRPIRRSTISQPRARLQQTIPKDGGAGVRLLGIPNVLDRLIQQAICQVLTPIFDPGFSESSFGFRPGRSAHGAAKRVQQIIRQGYAWCVDVDLSKFFDRVQHDVLMSSVSRKVHDGRLLRLIGRYLRAGVMVEGVLQPTPEGSPQGGPLSPLLSNILLDNLDKELERRGLRFVRYADDFQIFVRSERSAQRVFESVQRYLTQRLKLVVNEQKSSVRAARGCEYLGFTFVGKRVTIKVSAKKLKAFKGRVKELTGRSRGISMHRRLTDLNRYLRGWIGYFGLARQFDEFVELDGWIRRRVRMCYWKQWRYPRTRVRHLVQLGVDLPMAIKHAISRKRYWRMSRTPAIALRDAQQVAGATRASLAKATLGAACSSSWNRLARSRMLSWCGGWAGQPARLPDLSGLIVHVDGREMLPQVLPQRQQRNQKRYQTYHTDQPPGNACKPHESAAHTAVGDTEYCQ